MTIFRKLQQEARLRLLKMHFESGVGHIGGNLSSLDAMLYLHHHLLQEKDHFILSKGHAAGALYVTLWSLKKISENDLLTFHQNKTKLAGHPISGWIDEISFATGSLGHGLGLACGLAIGARLSNLQQEKSERVFCLMSDGEWQEGSNWESLIFLNHQKLNNLTIIIDCNGLQGFGSTEEVASMGIDRLRKIFTNFDLSVSVIDGHSEKDLRATFSASKELPHVVLMNTKKGKGVSFMEDKMEWHYLPLDEALYNQAKKEIENS